MSVAFCSDLGTLSDDAREVLQKVIADTVAANGGCRACDLTPKLLAKLHLLPVQVEFSVHGLLDLIEQMVSTGRLRAVDYSIPDQSFSTRTTLYPAGTTIHVR